MHPRVRPQTPMASVPAPTAGESHAGLIQSKSGWGPGRWAPGEKSRARFLKLSLLRPPATRICGPPASKRGLSFPGNGFPTFGTPWDHGRPAGSPVPHCSSHHPGCRVPWLHAPRPKQFFFFFRWETQPWVILPLQARRPRHNAHPSPRGRWSPPPRPVKSACPGSPSPPPFENSNVAPPPQGPPQTRTQLPVRRGIGRVRPEQAFIWRATCPRGVPLRPLMDPRYAFPMTNTYATYPVDS